MKALVVYDSQYGNTEQIARAIAGAVGAEAKVPRFGVLAAGELGSYDLLIVGSPTQEGKPVPTIKTLLEAIPPGSLKNTRVAAFDTRSWMKWVKILGFAAPRIADVLKLKGGSLIAPPEGFLVKTTKGPLVEGELERAAAWAKSLLAK
jgi:flavodoxin